MTPVTELTELLRKLQITGFYLVVPIPFGKKHLSVGGFHLVELQITTRGFKVTIMLADMQFEPMCGNLADLHTQLHITS